MESDMDQLEKSVCDLINTFTKEQNEMKATVSRLEEMAANNSLRLERQSTSSTLVPPSATKPKRNLLKTKSALNVCSDSGLSHEALRPNSSPGPNAGAHKSKRHLEHSPNSLDDTLILGKLPKPEKARHYSFVSKTK